MSNHLKKYSREDGDILSQSTDDLAEYILSNASEDARDKFNLAVEALNARDAIKTAGRLIYMLTRRFIVANKNKTSNPKSFLHLSHYFEDINGVVFSGVCDKPEDSATSELVLFKSTSVKVFEQKWAYDGTTVDKVASKWHEKNISDTAEAEALNSKRREELLGLLAKIEVGSVFAVYMVNEGRSPTTVGPPQDFYEVVEVVSEHSIVIRKIQSEFLSNDLLKKIPMCKSFTGEPMIKRLAMAVFCDEDGLRYNYLRFNTGGTNKHGYLLDMGNKECNIYRTHSKPLN